MACRSAVVNVPKLPMTGLLFVFNVRASLPLAD